MDFSHIRALIFDLDGTLIDSERDLVESTNATLRHLGRPELPVATVSGYIGHGAAKLVARALGPGADGQLRERALQFFLRYYEEHKLVHTRAYAGVPEALQTLSHMPMAVLTNKPHLSSKSSASPNTSARSMAATAFQQKNPTPQVWRKSSNSSVSFLVMLCSSETRKWMCKRRETPACPSPS